MRFTCFPGRSAPFVAQCTWVACSPLRDFRNAKDIDSNGKVLRRLEIDLWHWSAGARDVLLMNSCICHLSHLRNQRVICIRCWYGWRCARPQKPFAHSPMTNASSLPGVIHQDTWLMEMNTSGVAMSGMQCVHH